MDGIGPDQEAMRPFWLTVVYLHPTHFFIGVKLVLLSSSCYKNLSLHTMRTNARERFGTNLEQRFTQDQIEEMMVNAGLENIKFSDRRPYWCAVGIKK